MLCLECIRLQSETNYLFYSSYTYFLLNQDTLLRALYSRCDQQGLWLLTLYTHIYIYIHTRAHIHSNLCS